MWLQLLRTSGLAFSGLTAAVSWDVMEALRSVDIDGMLVYGTLGHFCRRLWHHRPTGPFENLSLLPPSKDIPFLTLIFPALRAMIIIMITAYAEHLSQTRNSEQSFVEVIGHIRHGAMSTLMIPGSLQLYVRLIGRKGQLSSSRGPIPP